MTSIQIAFDLACPESRVLIHRLVSEAPDLEVELLPMRLDPLAPADYDQSTIEHLSIALDITETEAREMLKRTEKRFAEFGLPVNFEAARGCNTMDAHVLVQHAQLSGKQLAVAAALFDAHFAEGRLISDIRVLKEIATAAGLREELVQKALQNADTQLAVLAKEAELIAAGVERTPTVLKDGKAVESDSLFG